MRVLTLLFIISLVGCGGSHLSPQPSDTIYCGIRSRGKTIVLEFQYYPDHTVSEKLEAWGKPWGRRSAHHLEKSEGTAVWASALKAHHLVTEGEYHWHNTYDHVIIITHNGIEKTYVMTKKAASKETPECLKQVTGFQLNSGALLTTLLGTGKETTGSFVTTGSSCLVLVSLLCSQAW
jgi:hypothetical protein